MGKKVESNENYSVGFLYILIPTIMLIFSYFLIPYPFIGNTEIYLLIPMFLGMILLLAGFLAYKTPSGSIIKILGWLIFAFYWSTQPTKLYIGEGNDIFNGVVCVVGVYILSYFAYHEWLSHTRKENISCLNWIAGASAICGIIYFGVEQSSVAPWLIDVVAGQSVWVYNLLAGGGATLNPNWPNIYLNGEYVVSIIFACTAIQSLVIFVGMIWALPKISMKKRIIGTVVTVIPVYTLNLLRNALVVFLVGNHITDFFMAHNVISKIGSLIALVVLLVILIKIIPEIFDEIICLTDIYKRNGPIEKVFGKIWGKK